MIVPDHRNEFRMRQLMFLMHSAKGSTWKNHKYIKRINGTYYYPDSYEDGRHLPEGSSSGGDSNEEEESTTGEEKFELSETDIENLAIEVMRGNFGNGKTRRELLGEYYQLIQDRVNEKILGPSGNIKLSDAKESTINAGKEIIEKYGGKSIPTGAAIKEGDTLKKAISTLVSAGKSVTKNEEQKKEKERVRNQRN